MSVAALPTSPAHAAGTQLLQNPSFEQPGTNGAIPTGWTPVLLENETAPHASTVQAFNASGQFPPPSPVPDGQFALEAFWQVGSNLGMLGMGARQAVSAPSTSDLTFSYHAVQTFYADSRAVAWAGALAEVQFTSGGQSYALRYFNMGSRTDYPGSPQDSATVKYVIGQQLSGSGVWLSNSRDLNADIAAKFGITDFTVTAVTVGNLQDRTATSPFSNMTSYLDDVELTAAGGNEGGVSVANPGSQHGTAGTAIAPLHLTASGGTAPYTWTASGLPAGLSLSTDGVLSGTPSAAGTSTVTATATDSTGASGSTTFSFQVGSASSIVPIAEIQGTNTDTSPYSGQTVTTQGVVTAVYPTGGFDEFVIETGGAGGTEAQDATPGASDAVFVYGSNSAGQVSIGQSVQVTGHVQEYQGETEIASPTVTQLANPLPAVESKTIPWSNLTTDAQKEAHEGELIVPQGDFTVSDAYDANFYGSFTLAAGNTPLRQPTDAAPAGSDEAKAVAADNAARMVTLDDGSSWTYSPTGGHSSQPLPWLTQTHSVRVGSKVTFHQAMILDYRFALWNFQPTRQVTDDGHAVATFTDTRPENLQPANVGGDVRLATFNVLNYFPMTGEKYVAQGLGSCSYYNDRAGNRIAVNQCSNNGPRGAANDASLARQQKKIVSGINKLGASIVSLEEIENSAQFGEPRDTAVATLVDALNADAGSTMWAYVPSPSADKLPPLNQQDVIRNALIYKPADVAPVGAAAVLANDSGPGQPFSIAREPFAQGFKKAGATDADAFLVVTNHWKSKGSGSPLYPGDTEDTSSPAVDQGAFNATRTREAEDTIAFANQVAASLNTNRIFIVGDLNSYTQEDPMQKLYAAGYTDLGSAYDPSEATYSFNSLAGSLDHVMANPAARAMATGADVWEINAQEAVGYQYSRYNYNVNLLFNENDPFAASDHDPVLVGLNFPATTPGDTTPPTVTVKDGASYTIGSAGVYQLVSFKLYDAGKIDKLTLNGVEKNLTDNSWSDLNYVKPGAFGAKLGENTLKVFDVAGNVTTVTFTLTGAPVLSFVTPTDKVTAAGTIPVTVSLSGQNLQAYNLRVDSAGLQYVWQPKAGDQTFQLNTTTLSNGVHTLLATATNTAGDKTTITIKITVNNP